MRFDPQTAGKGIGCVMVTFLLIGAALTGVDSLSAQAVVRPAPPTVSGAVVTGEIWLSGDLRGRRANSGTVVAAEAGDLDRVLARTNVRPNGTYVLEGLPAGQRVRVFACFRDVSASGLGQRTVRIPARATRERPVSANIQVPVRLSGRPSRSEPADPEAGTSPLALLPLAQRLLEGVVDTFMDEPTGSTLSMAVRSCSGGS